jgi:hypothetical protein
MLQHRLAPSDTRLSLPEPVALDILPAANLKFEIVYIMYRVNRLLSQGPPGFACKKVFLSHGLDREPLIPTSPLAVAIPSKTYTQPCIYYFLIYTIFLDTIYEIKKCR